MIACRLGLHALSRRFISEGWVGFDQIKRAKCACGKFGWTWFNGAFVQKWPGRP